MYWLHILHTLMILFRDVHDPRELYALYLHHHAAGFLRSGVTSGSGGRAYLWWLTTRHISPVDW